MKRSCIHIFKWLFVFSVAVFSPQLNSFAYERPKSESNTSAKSKPNVLLIMADDLGFSDLGCFGGEIDTPNLDRLAGNGVRFTQFYNTARCWPTRGALLTGYYPHQIARDKIKNLALGNRPSWAPLLPRMLKSSGYRSYHSGKWHLDGLPVASGFDRSYYLKDQGRFFYPKIHWEDDRRLPPVKKDAGYYGTTAIADHAIRCLKEHHQDHNEKPFFHYLAFTAPHFPLHALPADIKKYDQTYLSGWDEIREERWRKIQKMKLVDGKLSPSELEIGPPYHFPEALKILGDGEVNRPIPWKKLTEKQKRFQAKKMAIHAAMIDRMDQEIGRVIEQLKLMKQFDNTLIMFLSDNGASAEIMVRADGHDSTASPGSGPSYLCLGPGWSTTCNTPFRRHKTWVHEGGCHTPLIAHWPAKMKRESDRGTLCRQPGHVIDIVPTILEIAGTPSIAADAPVRPGISLLDSMRDSQTHKQRTLWFEHEGNKALRKGDWKIVAAKDEPWQLFQLSEDPTETADLVERNAERVKKLVSEWQQIADQHFADRTNR